MGFTNMKYNTNSKSKIEVAKIHRINNYSKVYNNENLN